MIKKAILTALCLSLSVMCISETAHGFEAIYECNEQLLQKFPNVEAIKKQFGDGAKWQESTMPSIHDANLELQLKNMEHPGIEIRTLGYILEGEDRFFITLADVNKAGFVEFLGIDVGSVREDVVKKFGEPQQIDGNELIYHDEDEFTFIKFVVENGIVTEMRLNNYLD